MSTKAKVILGIDPGYARVGWGVIRVLGDQIECVDYGCFETSKDEEIAQRLALISAELCEILKRHKPDDVVIEELFWGRSVTNGIRVSMARGVMMVEAVRHTGRIFEYRPNQVKQAVTGSIKADKKEIQTAVMEMLRLETKPKPDDAADALAIALTHLILTSI